MSAEYSIRVTPTAALLGEPIIAELRCFVYADVRETLTFDHRSLVVELEREGLAEPALAFPNRHAVERGGQLLRISSAGGIEDLTAGEERTRTIDLVPLFPEPVLSVGRFAVTYRLEEADPVVRPAPVAVEVASGPGAVSYLIGCLAAESSELRSRAADLLAVMTAQNFGYEAGAAGVSRAEAIRRWQTWWQNVGSALPWNFESDGATFGIVPPQAPTGRSDRLGGVAYPGAHG